MSRVAVLGTGIMGAPMARNLAAAGHEVVAWNRSAEKAEGIEGVAAAPSPAAAAAGAEALLTILADATSTEQVVDREVLAGLAEGAVWLQMATVGTEIERLAELAAAARVPLVDAPVLGTAKPAAEGRLVVLAAGSAAHRELLEPLFAAVGSRTIWVGEEPGAASRLKLVINHWILGKLELLVETVALAEALEVDPDHFLEAIAGGPLDSGYAQMRTAPIRARSFEPSLRLRLARKDVGLIRQAAADAGLEMPLITAVGGQQDRAIDRGHGDEDAIASITALDGAEG